jgi:hypothetical protein
MVTPNDATIDTSTDPAQRRDIGAFANVFIRTFTVPRGGAINLTSMIAGAFPSLPDRKIILWYSHRALDFPNIDRR